MARTAAVEVRPLALDELERTRPLWDAVASETAHLLPAPDAATLVERVRARLAESDDAVRQGRAPSCRVSVAWTPQDEPVGLVMMRIGDSGPLVQGPLVVVDVAHVVPEYRRAGVGRALLAAVARFTTAVDAGEISVHVPTGAREANRFYARWGFAPLTTRRGTTLAKLERSLPLDAQLAEEGRLRVLRRRRALLGTPVVRRPRVSPR